MLDGDLFDDDEMARISAALAGEVLRGVTIERRPGLSDVLVFRFDGGLLRIRYDWLCDWLITPFQKMGIPNLPDLPAGDLDQSDIVLGGPLIDRTGDEVKHGKKTD